MRNTSIQQIGRILGIDCPIDTQVTGYQIDSRNISPGEFFFALKGEKTDGHDHLREVREKGGIAAVVSTAYQGPDHGLALLKVDQVIEALHALARHFVAASKALIVGITGSVGKTTTKEFVATLLSKKWKVGKTQGSYNTKLTLPLTILNFEGDEEVFVLEMGMSEPGDIGKLLEIAAPDIALITKIAPAHIAFFPDGLAGIARGKAEIFSHPKTKVALFDHRLNEFLEVVQAIPCAKMTFSLEAQTADYFLSSSEEKWLVDERGVRAYQFDLPFHQPHILHDFLAAVSVARFLKMEWDEINQQVSLLKLPKMRFEQFEKEGILFINDAYNANPESMRAALSSLPEPKERGKRICVLAAMADQGKESDSVHREIGRFAQKFTDHLLVFGEEALGICEGFQEVKKPAEYFVDLNHLTERLKTLMTPGDVVLVKGMRKMRLERIFDLL
jgi:UDP-N-acetylmuramoyl-tripeptide--D-alanyl-D-alanine ligase